MCYKYSITKETNILETRFRARLGTPDQYRKMYHANGFSSPKMPVITAAMPDEIQLYEWGLIPQFAKTNEDAKKLRHGNLNAKSETVFSLPSFRGSIMKKRCLVLADALYESMDFAGAKYPHRIYMKDHQPFAFAGIYTHWKGPDEVWHNSYSIITTEANELMAKIHNIKKRMPVILRPEFERDWLKTDLLQDELRDIMVPLEDGILEAHPVSKKINSTKEDTNHEFIMEVCEYPELALS